MSLLDNFWDQIDKYSKLGFDPARWISGCSSQVDFTVLRDALREVRKSTVKVSHSWFDAFYHIDGKKPELTRRVFRLAEPSVEKEVMVKRALAVFRVHTDAGESPQALSELLQEFLKPFAAKVSATCTSALLTEHKDAQFALFDYVELHRGDKVGYMPAVAAVTDIALVSEDPGSEIHSNIAMTTAIERLNLLGCGSSSTFKLFPAYDAPTEELLDTFRSNLDAYTSRYNLAMEDYSSLKFGRMYHGTTAMATTPKELPTKYDQVEEGMEIIVTNKFGGLPALSLYMLARMNPENIEKFTKAGVPFESITLAKDEAAKNLSEPHFALGKIISKYLPDFGMPYDRNSHITAVYPVGARGIFAIGTLAELCSSQISISKLPMRHEEMEKFAAKESLVQNGTASLNGCHLIVASKEVSPQITDDLRKHNFGPESIGLVAKKGIVSVTFSPELEVEEFVASKAAFDRLISPSTQQVAT